MPAEAVATDPAPRAGPPRGAPHLAADEDALLACVHCGFCLTACPTYRVLGDENDSPRGRIYLMRALVEGRIDAAGAFSTHIGRCLGCLACETVCPAGVPYGALLERARADARQEAGTGARAPGRFAFRLLLRLLTGRAAAPVYLLLRLARDTGLAGAAGRALPGRAGQAGRLLAASRPVRRLQGRGARDRPPSPPPEAPSFALLEGCVMRGLFSHVHAAARGVLRHGGYREVEAPGQGCCGALHAHAGFPGAARALARRNLAAFEASGADLIAVDSAGCGAALREYPRWLGGEPGLAARARDLAARVRDVSELIAGAPAPGPMAEGDPGPLPTPGSLPAPGSLPGRAAYDAPCHLLHAQGVEDAPLRALERIEGLEVAPLPSSAACCGGAGIYNLLHPDLAARVLEPKVEEIAVGGYDWVATGNPGCVMQIGAGLRRAGCRVPVVHPVELLWAALGGRGGSTPRGGQGGATPRGGRGGATPRGASSSMGRTVVAGPERAT